MTITSLSEKISFIESIFGSVRLAKNSKNLDIWCPICAPSDRSKKKLSIRVDDDRNHCWTCGWKAGTLAPLLKKYSTVEMLIEYKEKFAPAYLFNHYDEAITEASSRVALPSDFTLLVETKSNDPDVVAIKNYLLNDRKIPKEDWNYFKLGYSNEWKWKRRVIVPSFDSQGRLNYFVGRAITDDRKPKYDNPDFDVSKIIFNELYIDWMKPVILCEGVFDMFKCGANCIPMLGSTLRYKSKLFTEIVLNAPQVYIALDSDMWLTKRLTIAENLLENGIDVFSVDTSTIEDPGAVTKQLMSQLISSAKRYDWQESYKTNLLKASNMPLTI